MVSRWGHRTNWGTAQTFTIAGQFSVCVLSGALATVGGGCHDFASGAGDASIVSPDRVPGRGVTQAAVSASGIGTNASAWNWDSGRPASRASVASAAEVIASLPHAYT